MDNRAGEMDVFVTAVEAGGFSAAGRKLGLSPSAVSKLVSRLEDRLGTRLLVRTTRALQLTPEGEAYLERGRRILAEIAETERLLSGGAKAVPRGRLRVSVSVGFGVLHVLPLVPEFLALYPEIELDVSLNDEVIDLIGERADVAIRAGVLRDSRLKARKLLETRRVIVASPAYLERHGTPRVPDDLDRHNCLRFNFRSSFDEWPFRDPATGERYARSVAGNFLGNSGATLRRLCLQGLGIARIGRFHVERDLAEGALVELLSDHAAEDRELIHAVFPGHEHLAARVRAFVDFLAERLREPGYSSSPPAAR